MSVVSVLGRRRPIHADMEVEETMTHLRDFLIQHGWTSQEKVKKQMDIHLRYETESLVGLIMPFFFPLVKAWRASLSDRNS